MQSRVCHPSVTLPLAVANDRGWVIGSVPTATWKYFAGVQQVEMWQPLHVCSCWLGHRSRGGGGEEAGDKKKRVAHTAVCVVNMASSCSRRNTSQRVLVGTA